MDATALLTLRQAAAELELSPTTLRNQLRRGSLSGIKLGRDWLLVPSEVARYREHHRGRARGGRPAGR